MDNRQLYWILRDMPSIAGPDAAVSKQEQAIADVKAILKANHGSPQAGSVPAWEKTDYRSLCMQLEGLTYKPTLKKIEQMLREKYNIAIEGYNVRA